MILKVVKSPDIYILPVTRDQNSCGLQCEVVYWPALAVGSAAHLEATPIARTNRLWTCSLQLDRLTYAPASHTLAFHPAMFSGSDSLFLVAIIVNWTVLHNNHRKIRWQVSGMKRNEYIAVDVWLCSWDVIPVDVNNKSDNTSSAADLSENSSVADISENSVTTSDGAQ